MKFRNIKIPPNMNNFLNLINLICYRENRILVFYDELFIKNKEAIIEYIDNLKPYYQKSKQHYLTDIDLKKCYVIFKQLCRFFEIEYTTERKYFNGGYKLYLLFHNIA